MGVVMHKDKLENAEIYYNVNKKFEKAFNYLKNTDLKNLPNGRYEIDGEKLYVNVQDYQTKPESEGRFEAHKKYADIQFIIAGREKMGCTDIKNVKPTTFYDEKNDIVFLEGKGDFVFVEEKEFVIFNPEDAHMPCIATDKPNYVKKAVVKVLL